MFDLGVVESADANKVVVKQTARVIMAIPHVKRLAAALNRQIEDYEQQHGPIPSGEPIPGVAKAAPTRRGAKAP